VVLGRRVVLAAGAEEDAPVGWLWPRAGLAPLDEQAARVSRPTASHASACRQTLTVPPRREASPQSGTAVSAKEVEAPPTRSGLTSAANDIVVGGKLYLAAGEPASNRCLSSPDSRTLRRTPTPLDIFELSQIASRHVGEAQSLIRGRCYCSVARR
jgi:hypothetical protein